MTKKEMFKKIIDEKTVIDPLIWLLKIEDKVDVSHKEYVIAMAERHKYNHKILKRLEEYFKLWKIE
ncbi:hypothetical protein [Radiobacillus deserti]|nr:hypothetical protein [Radiobacillus deserti]